MPPQRQLTYAPSDFETAALGRLKRETRAPERYGHGQVASSDDTKSRKRQYDEDEDEADHDNANTTQRRRVTARRPVDKPAPAPAPPVNRRSGRKFPKKDTKPPPAKTPSVSSCDTDTYNARLHAAIQPIPGGGHSADSFHPDTIRREIGAMQLPRKKVAPLPDIEPLPRNLAKQADKPVPAFASPNNQVWIPALLEVQTIVTAPNYKIPKNRLKTGMWCRCLRGKIKKCSGSIECEDPSCSNIWYHWECLSDLERKLALTWKVWVCENCIVDRSLKIYEEVPFINVWPNGVTGLEELREKNQKSLSESVAAKIEASFNILGTYNVYSAVVQKEARRTIAHLYTQIPEPALAFDNVPGDRHLPSGRIFRYRVFTGAWSQFVSGPLLLQGPTDLQAWSALQTYSSSNSSGGSLGTIYHDPDYSLHNGHTANDDVSVEGDCVEEKLDAAEEHVDAESKEDDVADDTTAISDVVDSVQEWLVNVEDQVPVEEQGDVEEAVDEDDESSDDDVIAFVPKRLQNSGRTQEIVGTAIDAQAGADSVEHAGGNDEEPSNNEAPDAFPADLDIVGEQAEPVHDESGSLSQDGVVDQAQIEQQPEVISISSSSPSPKADDGASEHPSSMPSKLPDTASDATKSRLDEHEVIEISSSSDSVTSGHAADTTVAPMASPPQTVASIQAKAPQHGQDVKKESSSRSRLSRSVSAPAVSDIAELTHHGEQPAPAPSMTAHSTRDLMARLLAQSIAKPKATKPKAQK